MNSVTLKIKLLYSSFEINYKLDMTISTTMESAQESAKYLLNSL